MRQLFLFVLLTPVLCCWLAGCGDGAERASQSGKGAGKQEPAATEVLGGAESPAALIARVKEAAAQKDIAELFACVEPGHRAGMAYFMGIGPIQMMIGMAEMLTGVGPSDQASEMKARVSAMKEQHAALLAKYDLPVIRRDDKSLQIKDQAGRLRALHKKMGDVDYVGFVTDSNAIFEQHATAGQKQGGGPFTEFAKDFSKTVIEIKKRGADEVSVRFAEQETAKVLLRRIDERWYLTLERPGA